MGERNTISSSFTVNTIEDGKDGMVYEIVSSVGSVTIPSDAPTATLSATLSFYRRQGTGAREAYSCCYSVFRKNGTTYTKTRSVSTKSTTGSTGSMSLAAAGSGAANAADAVVVCIYDLYSESHSGYLAELEIPVRKNGDTGDDGQDAATLVFEPDVVFVPCDSDGMSTDAVNKSVAFFIEINGTRYTPDSNTATAQVVGQDIDYTFSNNKTILNVDIGSGYSDIEGYIKVTATKTLNGVPYTASGCLSVVASLQGESGPRGKTGPMSYLAGDYDDTVNYGALLTDTRCPVVHFVNGTTDEYWYPTEDYRGAGYDPSVANGWKKADNFEMVVTKILFTQFAKLGGFVVSDDFMLSQYGELIDADGNKLTLTQSTDSDGSTHWRYNGVDAYTYFCDEDPMVEHDVLPWLRRDNWQYWSNYETTTSSIYVTMNTGDAHYADLKNLTVGDHYYLCGTDTSGVFHCLLMRKSQTVGSDNLLYGYRENITGYKSLTMFRPVKVVNAATGEEWMSSGKVHVGADGGVTVEGTIRAKNLYRNLCLFSNGVYSTEVFYISSLNDWSRTKGYAVGDYIIGRPDANAEPDFSSVGMVLCSYDADIIQMVPTSNNSWDSSNPLRLPAPKDFPGKVVEITGWSRTTSEVNMYVGSVMGSVSSMCLAVEVSGGKFVPAETATVIAIKTGTTARFMSMMLNGNYYWTKLNEK